MIVFVLVGVAYLTMLERKISRYIQFRKELNKVGSLGLLQPSGDGLKLLSKEGEALIFKSNYHICYICPMISIVFIMLLWCLVPGITNIY